MTDTPGKIVPAGQVGELFWEPGVDPAVRGREFLFFPGVPLHGKARENAVVTGIIDSGIAAAHPQLAGYVRACADFGGDGPEDTLGHGTAVVRIPVKTATRSYSNPPPAPAQTRQRFQSKPATHSN